MSYFACVGNCAPPSPTIPASLIILRISKNELKHIEIIGGVLGGIIAVFQFLLMVALKAI